MLSVAASRLGFRTHIYEPGAQTRPQGRSRILSPPPPTRTTNALFAFASTADVITYEFENIPTLTLDALEDRAPIRPGREALRVSQDRLVEKAFLSNLGLAHRAFADVPDAAALAGPRWR